MEAVLKAIAEIKSEQLSKIVAVDSKVEEALAEVKETIQALEAKAQAHVGAKPAKVKTIGNQVIESKGFESFAKGDTRSVSLEAKAVLNSDAATYSQRIQGVVGAPIEQLSVLDVIPTGVATSNAVNYIKETTVTDGSDGKAEGVALDASDFGFTDIQAPVCNIGHHIKMSEAMLSDNGAVASYIDQRIPRMVSERINTQLIAGNGLAGNLKGLSHTDNHTVFTGNEIGDNGYQSIRKAMATLETGSFTGKVVIVHPNDAAEFDLAAASSGEFLASNPRLVNARQVWGVPVVVSTKVTQGKFFLVDLDYLTLWLRNALTSEMSNSDADDFTKGLVTVRGQQRCALTVFNKGAVLYGDLKPV